LQGGRDIPCEDDEGEGRRPPCHTHSGGIDFSRLVSLAPNINSDCAALRRVEEVGRGFPLAADPNSIQGNQDPNGTLSPGPTTPAAGQS
jgi:hypothetical protein